MGTWSLRETVRGLAHNTVFKWLEVVEVGSLLRPGIRKHIVTYIEPTT